MCHVFIIILTYLLMSHLKILKIWNLLCFEVKRFSFFSPTDPSLHSLFAPILWLLFSPVGVCVPPQHLGCVPPRSHGIAALRSTQVIYGMTPRLKSGALCWSSLLWLDPGERGDGDGFTWSLLAADVALYAALKHGKNFKCLLFELHTHGWNWKMSNQAW